MRKVFLNIFLIMLVATPVQAISSKDCANCLHAITSLGHSITDAGLLVSLKSCNEKKILRWAQVHGGMQLAYIALSLLTDVGCCYFKFCKKEDFRSFPAGTVIAAPHILDFVINTLYVLKNAKQIAKNNKNHSNEDVSSVPVWISFIVDKIAAHTPYYVPKKLYGCFEKYRDDFRNKHSKDWWVGGGENDFECNEEHPKYKQYERLKKINGNHFAHGKDIICSIVHVIHSLVKYQYIRQLAENEVL